MANNIPTDFDVLEEICKLSGTTGKIAYEQGADFKTILKNAEKQLGGSIKKWNFISDESGKVKAIIGKNGKIINSQIANETTSAWKGANQLVTSASTSNGTTNLIRGDIIDEVTGKVTKKGAVASSISGANALMAGLGVLGGVATGVQWYKDNPDVWTDISNKLFQWTYADPYDKSWNDIFYDALVPAAIDSDGNTYLQSDFLETLSTSLIENGFYDREEITSEVDNSYLSYDYLYALPPNNPSVFRGLKFYAGDAEGIVFSETSSIPVATTKLSSTLIHSEDAVYRYVYAYKYEPGSANYTYSNMVVSKKPFTARITKERKEGNNPPVITTTTLTGEKVVSKNNTDLYVGLINGYASNAKPDEVSSYLLKVTDLKGIYQYTGDNNRRLMIDLAYLFLHGVFTNNNILNTKLQPDAKYPDGRPLKEIYPDWDSRALTTLDPNSTPDNPAMIPWYPVSLPNTSDGNSGSTSTDVKQADSQTGENTEESKKALIKDLIAAIDGLVIPWDNLLPSDPGGNVPDKPSPVPPVVPDAPVITGIANALWKVYNPTIVQLKALGSWLWSADPIEVIKKIFNNNPMDAIIGLHEIFVTPVTHGTENIKVGYVDSGVESKVVEEQYRLIDCGDVLIPQYYNNALDFGSTKVFVYLPFIGIHELNSYDVVGKYINITYTVDVLTGTVLAQITVKAYNYESVLYTYNGSCSVEYPLTSGSRASQAISTIAGAIGGGMTGAMGGGMITGVAGFIGGGIMGASRGSEVRMSGNLSGNAGAMGIRKPYIIVKRPVLYDAFEYNTLYGYPANETDILKRFKGYTRVKKVHVTVDTTDTEKKMIENALMNGVIIS